MMQLKMKSLKKNNSLFELLNLAKDKLKSKGYELEIAKYIYLDLFNKGELDLLKNEEISKKNSTKYLKILNKIVDKNIPYQYIFKKAYFYKREYFVNRNVLIPRFDSEVMIEKIIKDNCYKNVLEIGTGSGALIITLKKELKNILCTASDISKKALDIARYNARKNNAEITFLKSDLFKNIKGKYDLIIANLPYLKDDEINEKLKHEPRLALVSDNLDGLKIIYRLCDNLINYLLDDGVCYIEHNPGQELKIESYLKLNNINLSIKTYKDYKGLNRFSILRRIK